METNLIEKYDSSRINLLIGIAIGWTIYFGIFIFDDFIKNSIVLGILNIAGIIGMVIFLFALIRMIRINRIIRKDPELRKALNNEWIILNRHKSRSVGFWVFLGTVLTGLYLVEFTGISPTLVLEVILLVGLLSNIISFILFCKRG
jgi:hypothetical protein